MSKKVKGIILSILLVLCLGGLFLEIRLLVPKYIKNNDNNKQNNNDEIQANDKTNDESNNKNDNKNNNENSVNVYSKYPDIKWADIRIMKNDGVSTAIEIINNKLTCDTEYALAFTCDLASTINEPIKRIANSGNYGSNISILTESGKVYIIDNKKELKQILNDYSIIDMTQQTANYALSSSQNVDVSNRNDASEGIFYLTSDGKLIDQNGQTYEDINKDFVYSSCFSSKHYSYELCLFFSKDNSVSYRVESRCNSTTCEERTDFPRSADYINLMNNSNDKLIAKYIYDVLPTNSDRETTLIVDTENNLYEVKYDIEGSSMFIKYIGKIVSVTQNKQEYYSVSLTLTDGNNYDFDTKNNKYLNVLTHTWISLDDIIL